MIREFSNRIDKLRKVMERKDLNAILIMNPKNLFYISGFSRMTVQLPAALLVPYESEPHMILPSIELERSHETSWIRNVRSYSSYSPSPESIAERALGCKAFMAEVEGLIQAQNLTSATVGIEFSYVTVNDFEALKSRLQKTGFKDISDDLLEVRSVKDYDEIETLRDSLEITERGIRTAIELVQPGITELEVAAEVEKTMRRNGSKHTVSDNMIASGLRSGQKLASAKLKRIDSDEFVAIDVSGIFNEYCSEAARTIYTGRPEEKHKKVFELSRRALAKSIEQVRSGTTTGEIVTSNRSILKNLNSDDYMILSSHGIGLDLYEIPKIFEDEVRLIKPGMIICVKVEAAIHQIGGLRIEETVLVTDDSQEVLNKLPIETI